MAKAPVVKLRTHVERIRSKRHVYAVNVGGARNPENHSIIIENAGRTYVYNPRIRVGGRSDWFDARTIVADTIKGFRTDAEKALALCFLFDGTRYQRGNVDRHSVHPSVLLGSYGYGICGHSAAAQSSLAARAGLKSRYWELNHHTVTEVFFDGGWHMLDANVPAFYLNRDNWTIASIAQLEEDPDLVARVTLPNGRDLRKHAPWYSTKDYHHHYPTQSEYAMADRNLGYALKPFERFERYWKPVAFKYHDQANCPAAPKRYANGRFIYEPDLAKANPLTWLQDGRAYARNLAWTKGSSPFLRVERPQDSVHDLPAALIYDVKSGYVIVGGRLGIRGVKSGEGERDTLAVRVIPYGTRREGKVLFQALGSGEIVTEIDLAPGIQPWGNEGNYFYEVVVEMGAGAQDSQPGITGLDGLQLATDVQVAPGALPALEVGRNEVVYTDETPGGRDVRVIHIWRERSGGEPPQAPANLSPAGGEKVDTPSPVLEWRQPEGNGQIAEYQIIVSRWAHCRLPHCVNLCGPTGRNATHFDVGDWLVPGKRWYWKVRAKDTCGDWGPWSRIASFRT
ncbi:MAG: fibronectin type III domain-containing protein [Phycisphaerae bacterium]